MSAATVEFDVPTDIQEAAATAARTIREWPAGESIRLAKRTSNLFRSRADVAHRLDLDAFNGVFSIDPQARTAVVGGLTTYENLVAATLDKVGNILVTSLKQMIVCRHEMLPNSMSAVSI